MKWWNKLLDKISYKIPLDYENGYIEGFTSGLKFYKESIDHLHKVVLDSEKVRIQMEDTAKERRKEYENAKN